MRLRRCGTGLAGRGAGRAAGRRRARDVIPGVTLRDRLPVRLVRRRGDACGAAAAAPAVTPPERMRHQAALLEDSRWAILGTTLTAALAALLGVVSEIGGAGRARRMPCRSASRRSRCPGSICMCCSRPLRARLLAGGRRARLPRRQGARLAGVPLPQLHRRHDGAGLGRDDILPGDAPHGAGAWPGGLRLQRGDPRRRRQSAGGQRGGLTDGLSPAPFGASLRTTTTCPGKRPACNAAACLPLPCLPPPTARAQAFPDRAITLVSGFAPGGSTDITARLLADRMQGFLAERAHRGGEPARRLRAPSPPTGCAASPPTGYVLMLNEARPTRSSPRDAGRHALQPDRGLHPCRDGRERAADPGARSRTSPRATAAEVVAQLRAGPQDDAALCVLRRGSIPHFAAELIAVSLGLGGRFAHVPYRSGGLMVESIARGETGWGAAVLASAAAQVRDKRVRGIARDIGASVPRLPRHPDAGGIRHPGLRPRQLVRRGRPAAHARRGDRRAQPRHQPGAARPAAARALPGRRHHPWTRANTPAATRAFFAAEPRSSRRVVERTGVRIEQ